MLAEGIILYGLYLDRVLNSSGIQNAYFSCFCVCIISLRRRKKKNH